jgi:glyoxylase I family protein
MIPANLRANLYLDHVVLTVVDIQRTKEFYTKIFGEPDFQRDTGFMYHIGPTRLFFTLPRGAQAPNDRFDPTRVGLEHIAVGVKTVDDLRAYATALDEAGIKHSGIHIDNHSNKEKIWLDDPDKIRVEFYIRADGGADNAKA